MKSDAKTFFCPEQAMAYGKWLIFSTSPWKWSEDISSRLPLWWTTSHENPANWEGIEQPNRIGYGCENLLMRFIDIAPDLTLLRSRWPIREAKRTLGELDMILKTPQGIEHWELGLKFYCFVPERQQCIGANGRDRLDLKLDKIINRQLPMGSHPEVLTWCRKQGLEPPASKALVKGRMFIPKGECLSHAPSELSLNLSADIGYWLRWHQWPEFKASLIKNDMRFRILNRYDWMSRELCAIPCENSEESECPSFQLVTLKKDGSNWREHERWVVVHDAFPEVQERLKH